MTMAPIHLIVVTTLGFLACLNAQVGCVNLPLNHSIVRRTFIRKQFLQRRIVYYPNGQATFQCELLRDGDVHPNPGPDQQKSSTKLKYRPSFRPRYSLHELLELQHAGKQLLSKQAYVTIKLLGLNRKNPTRRGNRAGVKTRSWFRRWDASSSDPVPVSAELESTRTEFSPAYDSSKVFSIPVIHSSKRFSKHPRIGRNTDNLSRIPLFCEPSPGNLFKLCTLNVRSLHSKSAMIYDYVCDSKADLYAITETWLSERDSALISDIVPTGYKFSHCPRVGRRGGGTALMYRDTLQVCKLDDGEKQSFEFSVHLVTLKAFQFRIINLYRPPYSENHRVSFGVFMCEFGEFLQPHLLCRIPLLVTGDFNVHVDVIDNSDAVTFREFLESVSCIQHVNVSTHTRGHTLDLVISRSSDDLVVGKPWTDFMVSDHLSVMCSLKTKKPPVNVKKVVYRKLKSIDIETFQNDLRNSNLILNSADSLDNLVELYENTLSSLLDEHAPLVTKQVSVKPKTPWFNEGIRQVKRRRRKAEKKWLKSRDQKDYDDYKAIRNEALSLMNQARHEHYNECITVNSTDQKKLFGITKSFLNMKKSTPSVPPHIDTGNFVNDLGSFFEQKVLKISDSIKTCLADESNVIARNTPCSGVQHKLTQFSSLSESDVQRMVMKSNKKSCSLDPVPTNLIVDCIDILLPILTKLINFSLVTGEFHSHWKLAIVRPLLKKPGDDLQFTNFRPVSNLQYVSKLVEGAVENQIQQHLSQNDLMPPMQSAYRKNHSTETALLKVKNDLLLSMNKQQVVFVVLLDMSAAFDLIKHDILENDLESQFGITGGALSWLKSYLSDRKQRVEMDGVSSREFDLPFGVPQGSCLGPLLFTLYASGLVHEIQSNFPEVQCHTYADDTQLYISFTPNITNEDHCVSVLEKCISHIYKWLLSRNLLLNDKKTEFLICGTPQQVLKLHTENIKVVNAQIFPSDCARNLGVWFDSHLTFERHISNVCKNSFYQLFNIRHIRKYLTRENTEKVIHAFVTSRLDYCNSLLLGLPDYQISKLQRVQNACARLVCDSPRYSHCSPLLRDLHWLPVKQRIIFKTLLITYRAIHGIAPVYIQELVKLKHSSEACGYRLRSSEDHTLLKYPSGKSKITLGDRAFLYAAPKLWNNLPAFVRQAQTLDQFKTRLKTHLFDAN